jgi:hypothetical protein
MEKVYEDINEVLTRGTKKVLSEDNDIPLSDYGKKDQKRAKKIHTVISGAIASKVYSPDYFFDGMKNCVLEYETGPTASINLVAKRLKVLADESVELEIFPSTLFVKWKAQDTVKK